MEYKIYTISNKSEEKFLRKKAADFDFTKFAKKELEGLIKNMRKIMKEAVGIGLSANQLGLDMQLFVAEVPQKDRAPKFYAIFNPEITKMSQETEILEEGCLSVPGIYGEVERFKKITLKGLDKNQKAVKLEVYGLTARVFQHETDHLNGILFIDRAKNLHDKDSKEIEERRKNLKNA